MTSDGGKVKIGMIGCGDRIHVIVGLLAQQAGFEQVEISQVFDPDPKYAGMIRNRWAPGLRQVESYQDILRNPDIDWVLIGSWNCFHAEQVIAAFQAGKHVFCEKPLAIRFEDCAAMRKAWQKSGRQFVIGFTLRYSPHYRKIKELVAGGAIGELVSFEFNETLHFDHGGFIMGDWRRDSKNAGTFLHEKCSHDIDLANWMTGSFLSKTASFGGLNFFIPGNQKHIDRLGPSSDGRPAYTAFAAGPKENPFTSGKNIVDNQVVILEFANGVRATFHTNCNTAIFERRMYLCGTEGTIRADVIQGKIEIKRTGYNTKTEVILTNTCNGHGGGDQVLAEELLGCMVRGDPPAFSLDDGFRASITCLAIDEALETQTTVDLKPYWDQAGICSSQMTEESVP